MKHSILLALPLMLVALLQRTVASEAPSSAAAQSSQTSSAVIAPAPEPAIIRPMARLKVSATVQLGKTADWVAIAADAVWVGSTGPVAVNAIDPRTNRRIATVELPGKACAGLALGFGSLWVPLCDTAPKLAKINLKTHRLTQVFDIGPAAPEGGITTGAGSVWLIVDKAGTLARIDPENGTVRQTVHLPPGSYNPYYAEDRIWVTRADGSEITSVDAASGSVFKQVHTGPGPRFLSSGAGAVWTVNQGDGTLTRIDLEGHVPPRTLALGTPGAGGDITFAAGRVWTTFPKVPLSIIDPNTLALLCQWRGPGGDSLGIGHGAIWLTNYSAGTVSRIALSDIPKDCSPAPPEHR
jgi:virginiamycin B lyase